MTRMRGPKPLVKGGRKDRTSQGQDGSLRSRFHSERAGNKTGPTLRSQQVPLRDATSFERCREEALPTLLPDTFVFCAVGGEVAFGGGS